VIPLLPHLNAVLNGLSTLLLIAGYLLIRQGRRQAHKRLMITAFSVSVIFLTSYLIYHSSAGSVRFGGDGPLRIAYLVILGIHTACAITVPPLAIVTLVRGLRGRFARHKALARWTLPVWLFVNITGIVVYFLAYHVNPAR
jgi:uncharacterized membrane protein YozB (DUF420 family)